MQVAKKVKMELPPQVETHVGGVAAHEERIMKAIIELIGRATQASSLPVLPTESQIPKYVSIGPLANITPQECEQCCSRIGKKGQWVAVEDECLLKIMGTGGPKKKWCAIAALIPGRVGKQCRERWINHLMPGIKRGLWSDEEDKMLIALQKKMGNCWYFFTSHTPSRFNHLCRSFVL
jgi:hypothetical protein